MIDQIAAIVGAAHVFAGAEAEGYAVDITGMRRAEPVAVARPATTQEVADLVKLANRHGIPITPVGGRTGLTGGGIGDGLIISLERMNAIRDIRPAARVAVVEAGVILSNLHDAVEDHGLIFPLIFGARGSAQVGGFLGTNAGGSNVLRYGNTRDLVLGIEAVLPNGDIVDLMSALHKDNSGYDLRHLLIGAEGTLGIITAATLKLSPKPRAYATALVGMQKLGDALPLLNEIQEVTGGLVEAFEYMPDSYVEDYLRVIPGAKSPIEDIHPVNILIEIGALSPRDCDPAPDGSIPVQSYLQDTLMRFLEDGKIDDAVVAQTEGQRRMMWDMREAAAEVASQQPVRLTNDVAVPVDLVETFLDRANGLLAEFDPDARVSIVAHLGDGNIHYTVLPSFDDDARKDALMEQVEDIVLSLGGSFSAEHGIGTYKLGSMARRKDPAALAAMRAIKAALDPNNIMNPGKLLPPA